MIAFLSEPRGAMRRLALFRPGWARGTLPLQLPCITWLLWEHQAVRLRIESRHRSGWGSHMAHGASHDHPRGCQVGTGWTHTMATRLQAILGLVGDE